MDQGPLVIEQINAGAEFINRFDEHVRVRAAFWLKASDEGRWYLYIASDKIDDSTIEAAYAAVSRVAREMGNPNLDQFQIKLVGLADPLAQAAVDTHKRFVTRVPMHLTGRPFGGVSVDEVYVYPPPPYGTNGIKWLGIVVDVRPDPISVDTYHVTFSLEAPAPASLPGQKPYTLPRPAEVTVRGGKAVGYTPPEKGMPHLTQTDYEKKALEELEQEAPKRN
jgi:hypothetical protein